MRWLVRRMSRWLWCWKCHGTGGCKTCGYTCFECAGGSGKGYWSDSKWAR